MARRTWGLVAVMVAAGCVGSESRVGIDRVSLTPAPASLASPVVAKDGRLAYSELVDGKSAIFVAEADGRNPKRVSFGIWDFAPLWSPDGKWIAFGRDANGGDLVIIPAEGGPERLVAPTPTDESRLEWLPDATALLFQRGASTGSETWIYNLGDGSSEKLLRVAGNASGYPSPDGKLIAYQLARAGVSTVWVWDRGADKHRQLTTEGFEATAGKFSPDGLWLIFSSRRTGTLDLWRVNVVTGEQVQLTQDVADDMNGRWSPDGKRMLFRSTRGGQPDLWVLSTGESDVQRVTDDALVETNADWTPDGTGVVFQVSTGHSQVQAFPLDGGAPRVLAAGDWNAGVPSVSPDGKMVAYAGTRNGDADIWVVPVTGGESRLVSAAPGFDGNQSWSPDGRTIAFQSDRAGTADIWLVDAGGGQARPLTTWKSADVLPQWSPDGTEILFASNHESPRTDLWVVPARGGSPRRVTSGGISPGGYQWSPDGKQIAFGGQTAASKGFAVFVVSAAGGAPRMIASAETGGPAWSPDGREIAVQRGNAGYAKVEVYSLAGALMRTLTTADTVYEGPAAWMRDGTEILVWHQDLYGDGGGKHSIQPARGGSRRPLAIPTGTGVAGDGPRQFADNGRLNVVLAFPAFNQILRVKAPTSK